MFNKYSQMYYNPDKSVDLQTKIKSAINFLKTKSTIDFKYCLVSPDTMQEDEIQIDNIIVRKDSNVIKNFIYFYTDIE